MIKMDINGNTVSRSEKYLRGIIRNLPSGTYSRDAYGLIMVECGDGGTIRFYEDEEPRSTAHVKARLSLKE